MYLRFLINMRQKIYRSGKPLAPFPSNPLVGFRSQYSLNSCSNIYCNLPILFLLVRQIRGGRKAVLDPISVNILDWTEDNVGRTTSRKAQPTKTIGAGFVTETVPLQALGR